MMSQNFFFKNISEACTHYSYPNSRACYSTFMRHQGEQNYMTAIQCIQEV